MHDGKLTQTEILSMGWTKTMIDKLLPPPELVPNSIYRNAAPIKLWNKTDVLQVMETEDFKLAKEKADKRRDACEKAVKTKEKRLQEECVKKIKLISVKYLPDETLRRETLDAKQSWNYQHDNCDTSVYGADEKVIKRWVVNYIRHNLTAYDRDLYSMSGKVGCNIEYKRYKNAVLDKIAEAYPKYADECENQKIKY